MNRIDRSSDLPAGRQGSEQSGQSLIEILIGVAIGAILIGGAAATITLTLRSNVQNKNIQIASSLSQAILDQVSVYADADWHNIDALSGIIPGNSYHLIPSGSAFELKDGSKSEATEGIVFSTSFQIEPVHRNQETDSVESSSASTYEDPSTRKVIAITTWLEAGQTANVAVNKYITRSRNLIFQQTDWKDGFGQLTFPSGGTSVNKKFDDYKGVEYLTGGVLKKKGF